MPTQFLIIKLLRAGTSVAGFRPDVVCFIVTSFIMSVCFCCIPIVSSGQFNDPSQYQFSDDIYDRIKKDSSYWLGGGTATDLSFIGCYKEALIEVAKTNSFKAIPGPSDSNQFKARYKPVDAREFIIKKAKENQILIFNEAHYNPRHRIFVTSLLKDLKEAGYTYFAAETFVNDSLFATETHPHFGSGYYSMEPQFGNLIREATRLNYYLYPYEDTTDSDGKNREIGQARNLQSLLKKDPKAKIIVFCGYAHIYEDSVYGWEKAMAGRLKEYTGIDPYTVEQIELSESFTVETGEPLFMPRNPYFNLIRAENYSILADKNGNALTNSKVDALLYSPPTRYMLNRPHWVFENNKEAYFLNPGKVTITFPVLAKAYLDIADFENTIPVDMVEINKKEEFAGTALALLPGRNFIIKIANKQGESQTFRTGHNE